MPYTAILNATEDGVALRCVVLGVFPKPKLEWQDSDGNVLPAEKPQVSEKGGRYNVSLLSTVNKTTTNLFICVAKQEDIYHETKAEIYVPEKMFEDCKVSDQISGHNWPVGLGFFAGVVGTLLTIFIVSRCQRANSRAFHKICLYLCEETVKPSDTRNHTVQMPDTEMQKLISHSDSAQCGPHTAVSVPKTCNKCGETLGQSATNGHAVPVTGPAEHTEYLTHTQRATENSHLDLFQHLRQGAGPQNSTLDQSATNGHAVPINGSAKNTEDSATIHRLSEVNQNR